MLGESVKNCMLGDSMRPIVDFVSSAAGLFDPAQEASSIEPASSHIECLDHQLADFDGKSSRASHLTARVLQGASVFAANAGSRKSRW